MYLYRSVRPPGISSLDFMKAGRARDEAYSGAHGSATRALVRDSSLVEKRLHALAFVDALEQEGLGGDVESCRRGAVLSK
jgi:hypothetical protein